MSAPALSRVNEPRPEEPRVAPPKAAVSKPVDAKAAEAKPPVHTETRAASTASAARADSTAVLDARLPSIDVNAATNNISARAKQHVDSLGRTITVKPPTFDKPKDQP